VKTISGVDCATFFDNAHPDTIPCSYSTCRSLILPTAGAARFRNMNTRGPTPNKQMPKKGSRPLAMDAAEGSIVVNAPVADVYERWLAFEDYPKFITVIKRVRKLDANHFSASLAFKGKLHEATLEMMLRVPERRLAWRTLADHRAPDHLAAGVVSFVSRPDQSTCITLKLTSSFGGAVSRRVDRYLHNFKRLVEAR
jgi:uncharacterized membrane protein